MTISHARGKEMPNKMRLFVFRLVCVAFLLVLALAPLSCGGGATLQPPPPASYTLVWSDEFSGPDGSAPDSAKWTYDLGGNGWGNNELESYTNRTQNAQLKGGNLVITAQKDTYADPKDRITRNYTSARLKAQNLFSGRPKGRQNDIIENIGKEPSTVHGSLHGPSTTGRTSDVTAPFSLPAGQNFSDDFHLYAVEWEHGTIRFYVDTNLYATFNQSQWPAGGTWVFDHPFFIILNVAVGGDWPGSPDNSTVFPQQMLVDYVRVYTKM